LTLPTPALINLPPEITPVRVPRVIAAPPITDADTPPFIERPVAAVAEMFAAFKLKLPAVVDDAPVMILVLPEITVSAAPIVAVRVPAAMLVM
jgi:hypothetical protein